MRAATVSERAGDSLRSVYDTFAAQPLVQLLDALGLSDLQGMVDEFDVPSDGTRIATGPRRVPRFRQASDRRHEELLKKFGGTQGARDAQNLLKGIQHPSQSELRMAEEIAKGKSPTSSAPARIGGAGARIPSNSQAGVGTPEANMAKIPRFRSELGTFIKHEGQWWRIKEQPAGNVYNQGDVGVVLELLPPGKPEPGMAPKVLETRVVSADDLISGIREAKGVREPVRRVKPRFEE